MKYATVYLGYTLHATSHHRRHPPPAPLRPTRTHRLHRLCPHAPILVSPVFPMLLFWFLRYLCFPFAAYEGVFGRSTLYILCNDTHKCIRESLRVALPFFNM